MLVQESYRILKSDCDIQAVLKSTAAALVDATQAAVLVLYFCVLWESC